MCSSSPWHTIGFKDRRRVIYRHVNMYGIGVASTGVHREWRGHHISIKGVSSHCIRAHTSGTSDIVARSSEHMKISVFVTHKLHLKIIALRPIS